MENQSILDFSALLNPISKKFIVGKNIREHSELVIYYKKIKEYRSKARTMERQYRSSNDTSAKDSWKSVEELCLTVLMNHSKDIEIATWLCEALLRTHAFNGLLEGFKLLRLLSEKYWNKIFPQPDDEGMLTRLSSLASLNGIEVEGTLITALALTPLTEPMGTEVFSLWHYQQAMDLLTISDPEKKAQRIANGSVNIDQLTKCFENSSKNFVANQCSTLKNCLYEYQSLINWLSTQCPDDTPPSSRIVSQLTACIECIEVLGRPYTSLAAQANSEDCINVTPKLPASTVIVERGIKFASELTSDTQREQVLAYLLHAADYFRQTEPHSPLPSLLERAVRWGRLSFSDLLNELIQDEATRFQLNQLIGIGFK